MDTPVRYTREHVASLLEDALNDTSQRIGFEHAQVRVHEYTVRMAINHLLSLLEFNSVEIDDEYDTETVWTDTKGINPVTGLMWLTPRMCRELRSLASYHSLEYYPAEWETCEYIPYEVKSQGHWRSCDGNSSDLPESGLCTGCNKTITIKPGRE